MQKFAVIVASLLFCGVSHAASVVCTGSMLNYEFIVSAKTASSKVAGSAMVVVKKSGTVTEKGALPIVDSQFTPNQALRFTAQGPDSRVVISTTYSAPGQYNGTMSLGGQGMGTTVSTTCNVR
ncbi:MAG: hypothetical protein AB7K68_09330 [Bacteriovoracia bacterium]